MAAGPDKQVVTQSAIDEVCIVVAGEPVGAARTAEIADPLQHIPLRIAARSRAGAEVDGDGEAGAPVVGSVDVAAADQRVSAAGAGERIVAPAAIENIAVGIATQRIVISRSDDGLDLLQDIAFSRAADTSARTKVDRHGQRRVGVVDNVGTATARQRVRAEPADQRVVAATAIQPVGVVVTDENVGPR